MQYCARATGLFLLIAIAFCEAAFADDVQPGNFLPRANSGKVQFCEQLNPAQHFADGMSASMSARVTLAGDLTEGKIESSSGSPEFDAFALNCAAHTFVRPALVAGQPTEIVWRFEIKWHAAGRSFITVARPSGFPITCARFYPEAAIRQHEEGLTQVAFNIGTDGVVTNPTVRQPSGYTDLDQAAMDCVMAWRYFPATVDGKPATLDWRAQVVWKAMY